jgi:hypothetical protein
MRNIAKIAAMSALAITAVAQADAQANGYYELGWGRSMIVQQSQYAREFANELERPVPTAQRIHQILNVVINRVPNVGYQRALWVANCIGYYGPYYYFHGQANRIRHCSWNAPKVKTYLFLGVPYWSDPAW